MKQTVLDADIHSELPEKERLALSSGHSLRAGLASSADADERYIAQATRSCIRRVFTSVSTPSGSVPRRPDQGGGALIWVTLSGPVSSYKPIQL